MNPPARRTWAPPTPQTGVDPAPASSDAERAVLCGMLLSPEAIDIVTDIVRVDSFHLEKHRFIFAAILAVSERGNFVDALTVKEELDARRELDRAGGTDYILGLLDAEASSAGARHYAEIVKDKATRRKLITAGHEVIRAANDSREPCEDAERAVFSVRADESGDVIPISHATAEFINDFHARVAAGGAITGVKSGFPILDNYLNGLPRKSLIVIAARPSVGKTSLAMNIADHVALVESLGVVVFSIEMSRQEIIMKIVSTRTGINFHRIQRGFVRGREEGELITNTAREVGKMKIVIDDTSAITVGKIRARIRRIARRPEFNLSLVVIDYLQLMNMKEADGDNMNYKIGDIMKGLKALAKEMNVPVVLLSQLRRAERGKEKIPPSLSDLRDSGAIESDADIVLFIHRPSYQNPEASDEDKREAWLRIAKNRNGEADKSVRMNWLYERGLFQEVKR